MVLLATFVDLTWVLPDHPEHGARLLAANLLAATVAIVAHGFLSSRHRGSVELVMVALLIAVDVGLVIVAGLNADISRLAAGYVLVLPPFVALMIPWSTRVHVAWLAVHAAFTLMVILMVPRADPSPSGPKTVLALLLVSSAVSLLGHFSNLRARIESFRQVEQIRAMHRESRRGRVRLERLNALLERAATTDQLTGLGNRVALQAQLAAVRSAMERHGDRYVVLMLDLDRFKAINDRFGHFTGDDVLRRVARAVAGAMRAGDGAFRFGGEEFLVLARLGSGDLGAEVAERVRAAVADLDIPHPANPPHGVVTISIGAYSIDRARLAASDDAWLQQADIALYEAKSLGRNRAVIRDRDRCPPPEPRPVDGWLCRDASPGHRPPIAPSEHRRRSSPDQAGHRSLDTAPRRHG